MNNSFLLLVIFFFFLYYDSLLSFILFPPYFIVSVARFLAITSYKCNILWLLLFYFVGCNGWTIPYFIATAFNRLHFCSIIFFVALYRTTFLCVYASQLICYNIKYNEELRKNNKSNTQTLRRKTKKTLFNKSKEKKTTSEI